MVRSQMQDGGSQSHASNWQMHVRRASYLVNSQHVCQAAQPSRAQGEHAHGEAYCGGA